MSRWGIDWKEFLIWLLPIIAGGIILSMLLASIATGKWG